MSPVCPICVVNSRILFNACVSSLFQSCQTSWLDLCKRAIASMADTSPLYNAIFGKLWYNFFFPQPTQETGNVTTLPIRWTLTSVMIFNFLHLLEYHSNIDQGCQ
jgi:hypothetical protein